MTESSASLERDRRRTYAAMATAAVSTVICVAFFALSAYNDSVVFEVVAAASFCVAMLALFMIRFGWMVAAFWLAVLIALIAYRVLLA